MAQFDAPKGGLPVPVGERARPSLVRGAPSATFLSQLIAERYHLATQRARRQAPLPHALDTYQSGATIAVRRLPPGYRTHLDV